MVLESVAYYQILGLPVIVYLGILTLISLLVTAFFGYASLKGIWGVRFKWHRNFAIITIVLALVHGLLAFLARL